MRRQDLLRRLAEEATFPIDELMQQQNRPAMHQPVVAAIELSAPTADAASTTDIYVWFEDTSARRNNGGRGIAGLPECLLPYAKGVRVIDRQYAEGHPHLLSAARIRCDDRFGERIAAIYTAALSVGTIAWIGTGTQYAQAWREMYPAV